MGVDTHRRFHLQEPGGEPPAPGAVSSPPGAGGRVRRWGCGGATSTKPGPGCPHPHSEAAPSASRGEDEVEGLALGGCHVGVPQIHHEDHAGTLLRGTWEGRSSGVRRGVAVLLALLGSERAAPA